MKLALSCTVLTAFGAFLAGCGDDDPEPSLFPTCVAGEVAVQGELDAVPFEFRANCEGYSFVNAVGDTDGHFDLSCGGATSRVVFDFTDPLEDGGEVMAPAQFSAVGMNVGNCPDEPFWSLLTRGVNGEGTFTLMNLRSYPYCDTEELAGTLYGCYGGPLAP